MGAKPLDKAAQGVGLGGGKCFVFCPAGGSIIMFSEITVLSMLAMIIAKQVKDKTICQSKKQGGSCPPSPPGSYGPASCKSNHIPTPP